MYYHFNEFIMICRRPGGQRNGEVGEQCPPTENLNDFHNDFPPAGEAGGKMINDQNRAHGN